MVNSTVQEIQQGVKDTYNRIAADFAVTRPHAWPWLEPYLQSLMPGSVVFDFGCGHGRLSAAIGARGATNVGWDVSEALIAVAKKQYSENDNCHFAVGDVAALQQLPDNSFDCILCIAVVHHLPPVVAEQFFSECRRLLKPGGTLIVSGWNLWRPSFWKYLFSVTNRRMCKTSGVRSVCVPWKTVQPWAWRYHYLYTPRQWRLWMRHNHLQIERLAFIDAQGRTRPWWSGANLLLVAQKV